MHSTCASGSLRAVSVLTFGFNLTTRSSLVVVYDTVILQNFIIRAGWI